jgi:hypothetical protein
VPTSALRTTTVELTALGTGERGTQRPFRERRVRSEESPLQPRDAAGIIDLSIEGLLARLGPLLFFALAVWLPFRQVEELLGLAGLDEFALDATSLLWSALSVLPQALSASVVTSVVADVLVDRRAPLRAGFLRGLARTPGVAVLLFCTQIATVPLIVLLVVPYFLVLWRTWAAVPIYVLEGESLLSVAERARASRSLLAYLASHPRRLARALRRSVLLSKGLSAFGRWALLALIGQLVLGGVLELCAMGLTHPGARDYLRTEVGLSGVFTQLALGAAAALFLALSACLRASQMVAYYLDLRVRREGWDLELALRGAETRP